MSAMTPVHSVHFYDTDKALIDRLCGIVSSGLNLGNIVLLVLTSDHRDQLVDALEQNGVDIEAHIREGRFTIYDVQKTLPRFMLRGLPHTEFFKSFVGNLLKNAKKSARTRDQGLVIFGEAVSVLWDEGNHAGALALERLWNEILSDRALHLHCAYPRFLFSEDHAGMIDICECHSQVIGAPNQAN